MSIGMPQMETHFQHAGSQKHHNHQPHHAQPPTTSTQAKPMNTRNKKNKHLQKFAQ